MQFLLSQGQGAREVLSAAYANPRTGQFNTTEIHCSEFFPNNTASTLTTAFAGTPYLATLLLELWSQFLGASHAAAALPRKKLLPFHNHVCIFATLMRALIKLS